MIGVSPFFELAADVHPRAPALVVCQYLIVKTKVSCNPEYILPIIQILDIYSALNNVQNQI